MKILLIGGGYSRERELSLKESARIQQTLEKLGHEVIFLDPAIDLTQLIQEAQNTDLAYICLKEVDGMLQAILNNIQCPFTGSQPHALALAKHKAASKILFNNNKIPTPDWEFVPCSPKSIWKTKLAYPLVAKPNTGGSSIGVSIIDDEKNLNQAMNEIFQLGDQVILEKYLSGSEVACGVLGNHALPPILIIPKGIFFDYTCKYIPEMAEEISPAPIDDSLTEQIQKLTLKAHNLLGLKGYSRADFIINNGKPYMLEINSQPGMVHTSLFPKEAKACGLNFESLIEKIIECSFQD